MNITITWAKTRKEYLLRENSGSWDLGISFKSFRGKVARENKEVPPAALGLDLRGNHLLTQSRYDLLHWVRTPRANSLGRKRSF